MIGVLEHVEREDRLPASQGRRVVHRPLIDELLVARRPRQQHPARSAALRLTHRRELGLPSLEAAEMPDQRVAQSPIGLAALAKRGEEEFMQDH